MYDSQDTRVHGNADVSIQQLLDMQSHNETSTAYLKGFGQLLVQLVGKSVRGEIYPPMSNTEAHTLLPQCNN